MSNKSHKSEDENHPETLSIQRLLFSLCRPQIVRVVSMTTRCSTNPDLNLSKVLLIFLSLEKHVLSDHVTSFYILSRKHRVMRTAGLHALVKTGQYNNIYWRVLNPLKVFGQALARLCLLNFVQHQLCKYPEPRWSINVSSVSQPAQSWKRNGAQAGGDGTAGSS